MYKIGGGASKLLKILFLNVWKPQTKTNVIYERGELHLISYTQDQLFFFHTNHHETK